MARTFLVCVHRLFQMLHRPHRFDMTNAELTLMGMYVARLYQ